MSRGPKWSQKGTVVIDGLKKPRGLTIDQVTGTVYVADCENHRIVSWQIGTKNGIRTVAGGNGEGNRLKQLKCPADVIIDKETNSIIIADRDNRRVMKWSLQIGTTQGEVIIDNIDCWGLVMDNDGNIYVSDYKKHEVKRYSKGNPGKGVVVAGGNGKGDGVSHFNWPGYLTLDNEDSLYVSDCHNHRVMKWAKGATAGTIVAGGWGEGDKLTQTPNPTGSVVDANGTLYLAEEANHRVTRWYKGAAEGEIVISVDAGLKWPRGLSFDRDGNLFVSDYGNNRVQCFSIL